MGTSRHGTGPDSGRWGWCRALEPCPGCRGSMVPQGSILAYRLHGGWSGYGPVPHCSSGLLAKSLCTTDIGLYHLPTDEVLSKVTACQQSGKRGTHSHTLKQHHKGWTRAGLVLQDTDYNHTFLGKLNSLEPVLHIPPLLAASYWRICWLKSRQNQYLSIM